jgi:hypothetical protein
MLKTALIYRYILLWLSLHYKYLSPKRHPPEGVVFPTVAIMIVYCNVNANRFKTICQYKLEAIFHSMFKTGWN